MLRTPEEKQEILSRLSPSERHADVVDQSLIDHLLEVYHNSPDKIQKNTGPTVLDYAPDRHGWPDWAQKVDNLISPYIGNHEIYFANFFDVTFPHIIHNDDSIKKKPRMHKNIVIPLWIEGNDHTHFGVFDQCYLDGPVKSRHGAKKAMGARHDTPQQYYNTTLDNNNQLDYYTHKEFDKGMWEQYFTHQPYVRFHGLSIESINKWKPKDLIIFDGARMHCAADFRQYGVTRKIGLSIFTCI